MSQQKLGLNFADIKTSKETFARQSGGGFFLLFASTTLLLRRRHMVVFGFIDHEWPVISTMTSFAEMTLLFTFRPLIVKLMTLGSHLYVK